MLDPVLQPPATLETLFNKSGGSLSIEECDGKSELTYIASIPRKRVKISSS